MDGENKGNPIKMDDLGGPTHIFWKHPYTVYTYAASAMSDHLPNLEFDMVEFLGLFLLIWITNL